MAGIGPLHDVLTTIVEEGHLVLTTQQPLDYDRQENLYKPNKKTDEIIGIQNPSFQHYSCDTSYVNKNDLTQTIFDTTSRPKSARILLTNSTGATRYLTGAAIRGKLVKRYSGDEGFIHDDFVDHESIGKDGEQVFEMGNNFVVTKTQIEQLADYHWKDKRTKKHIYTIILPGTQYWYEQGEWYTLQVGGAGQDEYIDATVRVDAVSIERAAGQRGTTIIDFVEVEQNWTYDSSALARFLAGGNLKRGTSYTEIIVASSTYTGAADFYCDGTADEVQINNAINWIAGTFGGGMVRLTEGIFYTADSINLLSNIALVGRGPATDVRKNGDYELISIVGSDGSEKENCIVRDLKTSRDASDDNRTWHIYSKYTKNLLVDCITSENPLFGAVCIWYGYAFKIVNLMVYEIEGYDGATCQGIRIVSSSGEVRGAVIDGRNESKPDVDEIHGIFFQYSDNVKIINALIKDIIAYDIYAIRCTLGDFCSIDGCIIDNFRSVGTRVGADSHALGVLIAGNMAKVNNCKITNIPSYNEDPGDTYTRFSGVVLNGDKNEISNCIFENCGKGIYIASTGDSNRLISNYAIDNGDLIYYGNCEDANAPYIIGDAASVDNCSFARSSDEARYGTYSYKQTITAGGSDAEARLCDNATTTDMHELLAGYSYRLSGYAFVPSTGGPAVGEVELVFAYYDSGAWTETVATATTQDAFEFLETATVDIPSTATGTRAFMRIQDTASNGEYVYWDDLRLRPMGIKNEHSEQYLDAGTRTQIAMNSWQGVQV